MSKHINLNSILNGTSLVPNEITTDVNIPQTIRAIYDPIDWPDQEGVWKLPKGLEKKYSNYTEMVFVADEPGTYTIKYVPVVDQTKISTCIVTVESGALQSMTLSPSYQFVPPSNPKFSIDINPTPSKADFTGGDWNYDKNYVDKIADTPTGADFQLKPNCPLYIKLSFSYIKDSIMSDVSTVFVQLKPATDVSVNPNQTDATCGTDVLLTVQRTPPESVGKWDYDETYFKYNYGTGDDSFSSFTPIRGSDSPQYIRYYCAEDVFDTCEVTTISYGALTNVQLRPSTNTVRADDGFYIDVTYISKYAKPGGSWVFDGEYFEKVDFRSDEYRQYFNALKQSDDPLEIKFICDADNNISSITSMLIDYALLEDIEINYQPKPNDPKDGKVYVSSEDTFEFTVTYTPDSAEHISAWEPFDNTLFELISFDYETAVFKALKSSDYMQTLTLFGGGSISDHKDVIIDPALLKSITFDTHDETIFSTGGDLVVNITYDPESSVHEGEWSAVLHNATTDHETDVDINEYFVVQPDSTTERAHFISNGTQTLPNYLYLTYTSTTDMHEGDDFPHDKLRCMLGYDPLKSVSIKPDKDSIKVGDSVEISIDYDPNTAHHSPGYPAWIFDTSTFKIDWNNVSDDATTFIALKATTPSTRVIKLDTGVPGVQPAYTNVDVSNVDLKDILLSSNDTDVYPHSFVLVNATYEPDNVPHNGQWVYDKQFLEKDVTSTGDYGIFKAVQGMPKGMTTAVSMTYGTDTPPYQTDPVDIHINYDNINDVVLNPIGSTEVHINESMYIQIIYEPDTTEHAGSWDYDMTIFEYQPDSTTELAHFRPLTVTDGSSDLTYTAVVQSPGQPKPHKTVTYTVTKY